jgi:hypothetical protein
MSSDISQSIKFAPVHHAPVIVHAADQPTTPLSSLESTVFN